MNQNETPTSEKPEWWQEEPYTTIERNPYTGDILRLDCRIPAIIKRARAEFKEEVRGMVETVNEGVWRNANAQYAVEEVLTHILSALDKME